MPSKKNYDLYSNISQDIYDLTSLCEENSKIAPELYAKYDVKRGLRDINGKGVMAGLTEIGEVKAYEKESDGTTTPCPGKLYYHGYDMEDIVKGFSADNRSGFEETSYLLLTGKLPNAEELKKFNQTLADYRALPTNFVRDVILKAPSKDMMNAIARCVITMYAYDGKADDTSIPNVMRQCIQLIAQMPLFSVYSYQAAMHYHKGASLIIHAPSDELSTAENILHMLRPDQKYTELEAKILDIALVIHAEHGGGNNSTFTTHVVSSTGTDTYSAITASLGSLKGPKHGGANIKVARMFDDIKKEVHDWKDDDEIANYLAKLLHKEAFDHAGLIYGMGHAVYSISDPRAQIFKGYVEKLSEEKGLSDEFRLYSAIERLAPEVIAKERHIYKGVSANVDFYSGFVYRMLGLPDELFTPLFAIARISGWSAHRLEELINAGKIIRPAYNGIADKVPYIPMNDRK